MKTLSLFALLVVACANPKPTTTPEPIATTARQQFPMNVRWEERALSETHATLVVHVQRLNALPMPLVVSVTVPPGVVVKGTTHFSLEPNVEADDQTQTLELSYAQRPTAPAELHVDGDATSMGVHATQLYRFGRPEPEEPHVNATGPSPAGKGGVPMGPSVPMSP